ncbi:peptide/nickel transport system ATP-binding protein [Thermoanaerobacter thermohydrosulfuricus]|uniref:Oligopeptide/dipeptide ABC transporter, ATP-binding protein n=3 Tax=Thermoanaerobacter TaxID=1754 RepID=I9KSZ7_9THEO|nr:MULTISPECIES: ABC transporter ATP-binding protein [Thermoanaerobacter]KUJ91162.1 MAG: oligopeptide/dipeptide ABC transporter ATPase [Thermoanaerobacter thermocopriae]HAA63823.1 ABC transporter ATP-binding protein [Thermoanaerobacter sp.]EIW00059.1 oligopeptide/dipeptide ABC transporter, ATP-binding protein [Thermoanaerobacter siderophilus SR4]EMT39735.1 oligopeptide/dipeptide ABC transporter, ATPase subunit [Thermoanaerobacter thermohydrosulfuricus WC1]UZQ82831.1 ABC transporter ATP-binding
MAKNLVEFRNLKTFFYTEEGVVKAVNDVSFSIREGETVCIVGESGCGKSVTALSLMRLIQSPPGKIEGGEIIFDGRDILKLSEAEMRRIRGNEIGMIFQEPMTSLNPVLTIGEQIMEPLMVHKLMTKKEAWNKAIELIKQVGIPRAEQIMTSYPHELSGGMRQRIMIAIALSCDPKLLIADEPTTALDVTIQAQILDLLRKIKQERNMALMLITHDLGIVAEIADYVVVMYAGKVIEEAPVRELFKNPKHPYTRGLLKAKPIIGQRQERLYTIPGQVPNPIGLGDYCYFSDRCEYAMDICRQKIPQLAADENGHKVACWLYEGEWKK